MIYITSDTHFGHDKMFLYEPRGFTNIQEHDEQIIKNWNKVVSYCDDVYHLGDVMLGNNEHGLKCLKQLNGRIHIICGNHDTDARRILYADCPNVVEVVDARRLNYKKHHFFLSHYPTLCGNHDSDKPLKRHCISLCGHSHYRNPFRDMDKGLIYHCELDCQKNMPVEINKIIEEIIWFSTLSIEQKSKVSSMEVYNEKDKYGWVGHV